MKRKQELIEYLLVAVDKKTSKTTAGKELKKLIFFKQM